MVQLWEDLKEVQELAKPPAQLNETIFKLLEETACPIREDVLILAIYF